MERLEVNLRGSRRLLPLLEDEESIKEVEALTGAQINAFSDNEEDVAPTTLKLVAILEEGDWKEVEEEEVNSEE